MYLFHMRTPNLILYAQVVFGTVLEGMEIIHKIGLCTFYIVFIDTYLSRPSETVPKGSGDRPSVDVVIKDSGEVIYLWYFHLYDADHLLSKLPVDAEPTADAEGAQVPVHAEL